MTEQLELHPVADYRCDLPEKFGIPRQSGLVQSLCGEVVLRAGYARAEALRGLSQFSHIWLIWGFHAAARGSEKTGWSPTVRPPRLGGNTRLGVFATRSPFRPNPLGLSCVRLTGILEAPLRLAVAGADLLDGTPIYDIKPYLPYADSIPDAAEGYTAQTRQHLLTVDFPAQLLEKLPPDKREAAVALLAQDPRPGYSEDAARLYGMHFAGFDIRFHAADGHLTVVAVEKGIAAR